jgi:cold shock CspA family protein
MPIAASGLLKTTGGPDMLLHISALQSAGFDPDHIRKGERLTFDAENTRDRKTGASNVPAAGLKGKAK